MVIVNYDILHVRGQIQMDGNVETDFHTVHVWHMNQASGVGPNSFDCHNTPVHADSFAEVAEEAVAQQKKEEADRFLLLLPLCLSLLYEL